MNFRFAICDLRLGEHLPRRRRRHRPIANSSSGFSLVEVLVAVLILAILVAAASRGLVTSMASDSTSKMLFEGNLVMNRIDAARLRGESFEKMKELVGPGWTVTETIKAATTTNKITWRVYTLQNEQRPSLKIQHAVRVDF
jgi:prepilin-type N-terminal cleavage/methylation domain-containing protein